MNYRFSILYPKNIAFTSFYNMLIIEFLSPTLDAISPYADEASGPTPTYAEVFHFGLSETLANECRRAQLIDKVDAHCPKRQQGLSVGTYLAIAALNRAIAPLSKSAIFEWLATTTLRRHFPSASKTTLVSQRFWDHMERLDCDMTRMIWKDILGDVIAREALTVDAVCYDGTNFYTF